MVKADVRWTMVVVFVFAALLSSSNAVRCFHRMETLGTGTGDFASSECAAVFPGQGSDAVFMDGFQDLDLFFEQVKDTCG
eukprot:2360726-Rhodomonas_salina.1